MDQEIYTKIIARCWKDPAFKKRFQEKPHETLKEMGCNIPKSVKIKVVEDQKGEATFVIPSAPTSAKDISESELSKISGGCLFGTCCLVSEYNTG